MYNVYANEIEAAYRWRRWQQEAALERMARAGLEPGRLRHLSAIPRLLFLLLTPPMLRMRWPLPPRAMRAAS